MQNDHSTPSWLKLDNAAKIYPPAMSRRWAAMFRLSVTLSEPVDVEILKKAQESALNRIPTFTYKLRHGVFWHYLDRIGGAPDIQQDVGNPLVRIDLHENKDFMFRVRTHDCRIALEIFHALTDGMGGLTFLLTMTAEYLRLKYGESIPFTDMILDCTDKPKPQEMEDSFLRNARDVIKSRSETSAYHIIGTAAQEDFLHIITGIMPVKAVWEIAKARGCSITVLLVSLLVLSIQDIQSNEVSHSRRLKPVKVSVPVNLRKFYPTKTLRNFSSYINVGIDSSLGEHTLDEIINQVRHTMGREITEKNLNARFSANVKAEKNAAIRAMPLPVKVPVMKAVHLLQGDRYCSTTLSNLGDIELPKEMAKWVTRIDFMLGASKGNAQSCACISYAGNLYFTCTRVIEETDLERNFFTSLIKLGIPVKIESNQRW